MVHTAVVWIPLGGAAGSVTIPRLAPVQETVLIFQGLRDGMAT